MKKKLLAILLMMAMMLVSILPATALASEDKQVLYVEQAKDATWGTPDTVVGNSYGFFSPKWLQENPSAPIGQSKLRILLAGLKGKLLDTDSIVEARQEKVKLSNPVTVEDAITAFYTVLSNYDYSKDIGLQAYTDPVEFMEAYGIYSEASGEQLLNDVCSIEQAIVIGTRIITYIYDELDASSKGFFWEIESGNNKVYLLGSVHIASSAIYPLSQKIIKAYADSDALVLEADLYKQDEVAAFSELIVYSDGTTLEDHVSEEVYNKTLEAAQLFGISSETAGYLKAWYWYMLFDVTATAGVEGDEQLVADLGVDMTFLNDAVFTERPVYQIEGALYQGQVIDSFSDELQELLLSNSINTLYEAINGTASDDVEDANELINYFLDWWHDGDVESFKRYYVGEDMPVEVEELDAATQKLMEEYRYKFLTQRDEHMAEYIDDLLKSEGEGTYFVVVGALHYVSDYSVLDILKEMGYEINQIK